MKLDISTSQRKTFTVSGYTAETPDDFVTALRLQLQAGEAFWPEIAQMVEVPEPTVMTANHWRKARLVRRR